LEATDKAASSPEGGYYLLFVDGNRNGPGGPLAGGELKYRHNGKWSTAPDGGALGAGWDGLNRHVGVHRPDFCPQYAVKPPLRVAS
jgi:hypothetical protein